MDYSIFMEVLEKYAQTAPQNPNQNLDPNQLQVGQQVYSPTGDALVVIENPMDTTTTTLMPADQTGTDVPQDVQTPEESELAAQYTLQPNEATPAVTARSRKAQDGSVNWADLEDIASEMNSAIQEKDLRGVLAALEDMFEMAMSNVNLPEGTKVATSIFAEYINER